MKVYNKWSNYELSKIRRYEPDKDNIFRLQIENNYILLNRFGYTMTQNIKTCNQFNLGNKIKKNMINKSELDEA